MKYEAEGFCSACRRSNVVKALMLNSKIVLSTVVCVASLKMHNSVFTLYAPSLPKTHRRRDDIRRGNSHADELAVRQQSLQPVGVSHAEGQLGRIGIVREDRDDAGGEREHHVAAELHLAPGLVRAPEVGMYDLVKGHR